jgi:hypothetical protein
MWPKQRKVTFMLTLWVRNFFIVMIRDLEVTSYEIVVVILVLGLLWGGGLRDQTSQNGL